MASQIDNASTEAFFKAPREFVPRFPNGMPIGKRTVERQKQNRILNERLPDIKKSCELRLPGCLGNKFLSWAHSKKSRFITTDKDWQEAARSCLCCHQKIEAMSHAEMKRLVVAAIKKRGLSPRVAASTHAEFQERK